jgi:uncharacterized protein (TIGR00251 family)
MKITETKDGAVIQVFVKPNAPRFNITVDGDEIVVFCTEQPVRGKVNKELMKEFSKLFHAKVEIVSGLTSKKNTTVDNRRFEERSGTTSACLNISGIYERIVIYVILVDRVRCVP